MIKKFRKKGSPDPLKNLVTHMLQRITSATPFIIKKAVLTPSKILLRIC